MSELAFNCIRLQFMLHHAHMQVILLTKFCGLINKFVSQNGGNYISGKPVATVFFFWSCVTFVIDNLVLKLCEPRFKLRTSWKIRIGDVLREERF